MEKIIAIKIHQKDPDAKTWEYFLNMLERLGTGGMSSEEEAQEKTPEGVLLPVFRVKLCMWRAPEIGEYLKVIDDNAANPAVRGKRGSRALPRFGTTEVGVSPAPTGLPVKMYNPEWLGRQRAGWVEEELQVSRETFELLTEAMSS